MFKGSEDIATKGFKKLSLSITPLLIGASLRENPSKYLHKPSAAGNQTP